MKKNLCFEEYQLKKVHLIHRGEVVGEAIIFSKDYVSFHLWETLKITRRCSFDEISKKYQLQIK